MRRFERPFASNISESYAVCAAHAGRSHPNLQEISRPKSPMRSDMFPLHDDRQQRVKNSSSDPRP